MATGRVAKLFCARPCPAAVSFQSEKDPPPAKPLIQPLLGPGAVAKACKPPAPRTQPCIVRFGSESEVAGCRDLAAVNTSEMAQPRLAPTITRAGVRTFRKNCVSESTSTFFSHRDVGVTPNPPAQATLIRRAANCRPMWRPCSQDIDSFRPEHTPTPRRPANS